MIRAIDVKDQIPWEKAEGVVVLVLMPKGQINRIHFSSVTVNEIAMLSKQLDAHLTYMLGPMLEGVDK